jgi:hypothetical protein
MRGCSDFTQVELSIIPTTAARAIKTELHYFSRQGVILKLLQTARKNAGTPNTRMRTSHGQHCAAKYSAVACSIGSASFNGQAKSHGILIRSRIPCRRAKIGRGFVT